VCLAAPNSFLRSELVDRRWKLYIGLCLSIVGSVFTSFQNESCIWFIRTFSLCNGAIPGTAMRKPVCS
jgi:hypothetical protein